MVSKHQGQLHIVVIHIKTISINQNAENTYEDIEEKSRKNVRGMT